MAGRGSGGVQAGEEGSGRRLVVPAGRGATGGGSRTSGEFLLKMNSGEAGAAARGEERYGSWGKWIEEGVGVLIGVTGGAGKECASRIPEVGILLSMEGKFCVTWRRDGGRR